MTARKIFDISTSDEFKEQLVQFLNGTLQFSERTKAEEWLAIHLTMLQLHICPYYNLLNLYFKEHFVTIIYEEIYRELHQKSFYCYHNNRYMITKKNKCIQTKLMLCKK